MQESNLDQNNISQPPPAEVKVPNSKNKLPIILIIFLFVIILFSGGYIFLGNKIFHQKLACKVILRICKDGSTAKLGPNCTQTCPEDSISQTPSPKPITDETASPVPNGIGANWKTYTNRNFGFSIKYPTDQEFEVNETLKNTIFIAAPQSDYGVVISIKDNPNSLPLRDWLASQNLGSTQINGQPLKFSDFQLENKTVGNQIGLKVGPSPSYILVTLPIARKILSISGYTLEEKLFDQILSTFRFAN